MYIMVCISYSLLQASSISLQVCVPGSSTPFVAMPVYGTFINSASLGAWAGVMSLSVSVLLLMYAYANMMVYIQYTTMKSVTVLQCMLEGSDL